MAFYVGLTEFLQKKKNTVTTDLLVYRIKSRVFIKTNFSKMLAKKNTYIHTYVLYRNHLCRVKFDFNGIFERNLNRPC